MRPWLMGLLLASGCRPERKLGVPVPTSGLLAGYVDWLVTVVQTPPAAWLKNTSMRFWDR